MLEVGIYFGDRRARREITKVGEPQMVTVLKPDTQSADIGSRLFVDTRPGAGHPDWEMRYAAQEAIAMRKSLLEGLQERNASSAELDAADVEFVAALKQLDDLRAQLKERIYLEQEASKKESKDAIAKDVGDSG